MPPHETVYHFQIAPVPNEPPATFNVDDAPWQIIVGDATIPVGIVDNVLIPTIVLAQVVVLQIPAAKTK